MKISRKLLERIHKEIYDAQFDILCALDEKDRTDQISHEVWRELQKKVVDKMRNLSQNIDEQIQSYSGKR
jgi:transcription termination factor NusB